jgi:Tfp pilus assembly protein PilZ
MVMNSIEPELRKGIVILQSKKLPREHLEVPLLYSIRNNDEDYTGRMEHAMEGGILINIKDHLAVGTNLDIEIFLPEYCGLKSIKAITQIVWTQLRGAKDGDEYEYGLKFIDMDGDNIARLKKLLDCLE